MRLKMPLLFLACWPVLQVFPLIAQRTTANMYGNVQDASSAVVPGAQVRVTNEQTSAQFNSHADEHGDFAFTFLPLGRYRIDVEAPGFKAFSQTGVALDAGEQIRYQVVLQVGAASEKITVTADAPVLQNASPQQEDRVSTMQIRDLPHGNRDWTNLLSLENGYNKGGDGLAQFNGLATGGLTLTVDGVDGSGSAETSSPSMFQNFNPIKVMSEEAIQEVSVTKGVMSAEYAHAYSGNINVITKGGTNQFHGSLFEANQNSVFNAKSAQQKPGDPKPPVHINQFGGSFGGPIRKDKLFFFFTYEGYRQQTTGITTGQVPTADFRAQLLAAQPSYKQILDYYPLPTQPIAGQTQVGLFQGLAGTTSDDNNIVAKGDYMINATNRLSLRYNHLKPEQLNPRFPPTFRRNYTGTNESGTASFFHTAPSWTAETRFGYNLIDVGRVETLYLLGALPAISLKNVVDTQGEGYFKRGHSYSIEEVIAKTIGRHTIKMGGVFGRRNPENYDNQVPIFTYANTADLLANRPNGATVTLVTPDYHAHSWELGGFVQDDFRINSNFILNIGLRYEYFSVLKVGDAGLYNPDGPYAAVQRPVVFRPADSEYRPDYNNFEPRIGFAWNPDKSHKTVIRSGVGVFLAQPLLNNFESVYASASLPTRLNFSQADVTNLGLKYPMTNDDILKLFGSQTVPVGYNVVDPNYRNPYSVQWSLDVQRQLTPSLALETGYVGNKGLKIFSPHNINLPDRNTGIRPFPNALQSQWGNNSDFSYYHAWETSLRKRFSQGLLFDFHYTWAKAMSISTGDFYSGNNTRLQDETNWRANKGPATFDAPHRIAADWVYELPLRNWVGAHRTLRAFASGWQISGTLSVLTADRLDITEKSSYDSSRPDYIGGNIYSTTGDRFQWFNTAAFAQVPIVKASGVTARPGNIGKYAVYGPGNWSTGINLAKTFTIAERYHFQIRADAYNAFNHVNLGDPVTEITSATFGRILSVGAGRTMQMNARMRF